MSKGQSSHGVARRGFLWSGGVGGGESVSGVRGIKDLGPHLLGLVKVLRGGEGDPHFVLG